MNLKPISIPLVVLVCACGGDHQNLSNEPDELFPAARTVDLNQDGFQLNPWTGDSIYPFSTALYDTLPTGIPLELDLTQANMDSVLPPIVAAGPDFLDETAIDLSGQTIKATEGIQVLVNQDSLTKIRLGEGDPEAVLLSTNEDTLLTGQGLRVTGHVVPIIMPKNKLSLPEDSKDNTLMDLSFLTGDQGLPAPYFRRAYADKDGNMWFGTFAGGVARYDGTHIASFSEQNGLSNENVYAILQDKDGAFWFGTEGGGVNYYDGESITQYTEKEGFCNDNVYDIIEDAEGNIWIGTYQGLAKYDGEMFTYYGVKEGMSTTSVRCLLEDSQGNIWIGTEGAGAMKYDGSVFTHYSTADGLAFNLVYDIQEDDDGSIWFGTKWGISRFDGATFTKFDEEQGIVNSNTYVIEKDRKGNLWFGSIGGGVTMYDGTHFTKFTEDYGLTNNLVLALGIDPADNIWIGTYGGGINRLNPKGFSQLTDNEGIKYDVALSMNQTKDSTLWFGLYGGGMSMKKEDKVFNITRGSGMRSTSVMDFYEDDDKLWFTEYGIGLSYFQNGSVTQYDMASGLGHDVITGIEKDKAGNYWFSSEGGGMTIFNGNQFSYLTENEGLNDDFVSCMISDKDGNIWYGTFEAGIGCYDGSQFTYYTPAEGLAHEVIYSLIEDKEGNIWVGTKGGLCKFDGKKFTNYSMDEGMSANAIRSIQEDKDGNIWAGTTDGLNVLIREDGDFTIRSFDKRDGLKSMDFFPNSAMITAENELWLGGGQGLEILDLDMFEVGEPAPQPRLTSVTINEQKLDYRNLHDSMSTGIKFEGVEPFENYPQNLELDHDKNHLTFYFTALDWESPQKILYTYRIPQLNPAWSTPSHESKAEFRNLDHGNLSFELKASGISGEWSESFVYEFEIKPPWWATSWAYGLYILLGVLIVVLLIKWRTAKLKRRQKELETQVDLATQEIKQQKEQVEIAHAETEKQKAIIEETHREITDSIAYAKHLQDAILPSIEEVDKHLENNFILFEPKDVVSGDFYWFEYLNGVSYIAAADCTGHGVPGAMVSVVCSNALNRTVNEFHVTDPAKILDMTRDLVIKTFDKSGSNVKDGMDIALCALSDPDDAGVRTLRFSGAHNPVWIIRKGGEEIEEIKANKQPIGKFEAAVPFITHEVKLEKDDTFYIFSDGYADQFGGEKGKKFKTANFKKLLLSIQDKGLEEQKSLIANSLFDWKGDLEQVDDICVIGVRG